MNFALELFRKRQIPTIVYLFVSIIAYLLSFRQSVVSYTTERDQMSYKTYVVEGGYHGIFDSINTFWHFDVCIFSLFALALHLVRSVWVYFSIKLAKTS